MAEIMTDSTNVQESSNAYSIYEDNNSGKAGKEANSVKSDDSNSSVAAHDFHRLMESFTNEIKLAVPCDGIKYRADNMDQHFVTGVLDNYLCCFEIKVADRSFGNIYFARETQFMDTELSILENMVAGLVLPLCHLLQVEISPDSNDAGEEQASLNDAVSKQQI